MAKSDSTRKPPPRVWLVFDAESRLVDWANHRLGIAKSDEQAHQYAPVQKPKRCVWRRDAETVWFSPCHGTVLSEPEQFCPRCGGRIKIVRKA